MFLAGPWSNVCTKPTCCVQRPAYLCAGCGSTCGMLTALSGSFTDGSGLSGYSNNANCEWMIAPVGVLHIMLSFSELSTQPGVDIISVMQCSDIVCSELKQLGELSGSYSTPQVLTATTGYMKVVFTSDQSINYDGFNASWTAVSQPMLILPQLKPFFPAKNV